MKNIDLQLFHLFTLFLINLKVNETAINQCVLYYKLITIRGCTLMTSSKTGGVGVPSKGDSW